MESKPAQNIQDSFLNTARKDKSVITIYLLSGVKLSGRIRSFDKYSVVLDTNNQEQLIFKHAISTVVMARAPHLERHARRLPRHFLHTRIPHEKAGLMPPIAPAPRARANAHFSSEWNSASVRYIPQVAPSCPGMPTAEPPIRAQLTPP